MKTCKKCGDEYDKPSTNGFSNQCEECNSEIEDIRYLGFNDGTLNKSTSIAVYRGTNKTVRKKIANQKARTGM